MADIGNDAGPFAPPAIPPPPPAPELRLTETPAEGFPDIEMDDPDALYADLAPERANALRNGNTEPVLLFQVYNVGFPTPQQVQEVTEAATTVINSLRPEPGLLILPPEPPRAPDGTRVGSPITWTALGVSRATISDAIRLRVMSTTRITLIFYSQTPAIPRYLFTLTGFVHNRDNSILNAVAAVFGGPVIFPATLQLTQGNPAFRDVSPEQAAWRVIRTLEVRVVRLQNGNILAAIYCDPPTTSVARWRAWRNLAFTQMYPSNFNATGFARRRALCAGCHGADHPTHLCPFQDVPGWNAPPPGTTMSTTNVGNHPAFNHGTAYQPRGGGPSRGFRGRGRGNGRGWH
ncbi:hypothetical protein FKP32DRAFT_1603326 [Trametes sanguinea]|nr:hypothetical protein FKP32DRAFT_1603326 [Trametes sanguinea]